MNVANRPTGRTFGLLLSFLTTFVPSVYSQETGSAPPDTGQTNAEVISEYKTMSLEQLMSQQVTSVAKTPQPYKDAPAAIDVITSNDIQRSGATSLPQALRLANNLDVEQLTSSEWDISARGFNTSGFSDKMLVLMDGRGLYSPLLAGVIWNLEDYLLPDIDRIEVISGPGGALWGANAVNGVINITTKNAADTQGLLASAAGGTWMQTQEQARYGGTISSNIFYRVYGKYVQYGAERYPDGSSAHDNWNRGMGGFRIDATPSPGNLFTLEGNMLGGDNDVAPGGEGTPVIEGTSSDGNVLGQWKHKWSDDSDMQLQLYYDRTHLSAPFESDT
ncbi:MAG: TonB-dependent receptor plug domain-containing protein, partial [Limisphaerales bacterium]